VLAQSQINRYRRKLGAKQALHATHWPRICGLAASADVWLRATETEINAALWVLVARKDFTFSFSLSHKGAKAAQFGFKRALKLKI